MNTNVMIAGIAGLVAGYFIAESMKPTAKVGAVSLPCECAGGGRCNSGKSDCSCCPTKYGRVVPYNQAIPVQLKKMVGI